MPNRSGTPFTWAPRRSCWLEAGVSETLASVMHTIAALTINLFRGRLECIGILEHPRFESASRRAAYIASPPERTIPTRSCSVIFLHSAGHCKQTGRSGRGRVKRRVPAACPGRVPPAKIVLYVPAVWRLRGGVDGLDMNSMVP